MAVRADCGPTSGKEAGGRAKDLGGISKSHWYPKQWGNEAPREKWECGLCLCDEGQIWNPGKWGLGPRLLQKWEGQLAPLRSLDSCSVSKMSTLNSCPASLILSLTDRAHIAGAARYEDPDMTGKA